MIILLTFESFAREKTQEPRQNLTIVLNLFAEFIAHLVLFILLSMYQETQMKTNNAFFNASECSIISLSM